MTTILLALAAAALLFGAGLWIGWQHRADADYQDGYNAGLAAQPSSQRALWRMP